MVRTLITTGILIAAIPATDIQLRIVIVLMLWVLCSFPIHWVSSVSMYISVRKPLVSHITVALFMRVRITLSSSLCLINLLISVPFFNSITTISWAEILPSYLVLVEVPSVPMLIMSTNCERSNIIAIREASEPGKHNYYVCCFFVIHLYKVILRNYVCICYLSHCCKCIHNFWVSLY